MRVLTTACITCAAQVAPADADSHAAWHQGLTEAIVYAARRAAAEAQTTQTTR